MLEYEARRHNMHVGKQFAHRRRRQQFVSPTPPPSCLNTSFYAQVTAWYRLACPHPGVDHHIPTKRGNPQPGPSLHVTLLPSTSMQATRSLTSPHTSYDDAAHTPSGQPERGLSSAHQAHIIQPPTHLRPQSPRLASEISML